ncbi:DUF3817 domain-containing protein [Litoribrevibacter euphylliae]|uniref:DUF3817 domain-containing protein n=1 Tax=Litoribrevibacter euphylliae TaxID=1834034 RepID=A0ABV7HP92_9GAMM
MLNAFRAVSLLEGLSYLLILSVTLGFISRDLVFYLGMTHGVLFLLYLVISLAVAQKQQWSVFVWLGAFIASVIPFGFIPLEMYLRKSQSVEAEAELV